MSYPTEPTKVLPGTDASYEPTVAISDPNDDAQRLAEEEAQRAAAEAQARQDAERAARDQALGAVPTPLDDDVMPEPVPRADNDRFFPSLGLMLVRLTLAAFIASRGVQVLFDINGTTNWLTDQNVPWPHVVTWVLAVGLLVCAAMFVLGFGTRVAGAVIAATVIAVLVYIRWGYTSVFVEGQTGFTGDVDLLVGAMALLLLFVGAGGWAIDAGMRHARARHRQYEQ